MQPGHVDAQSSMWRGWRGWKCFQGGKNQSSGLWIYNYITLQAVINNVCVCKESTINIAIQPRLWFYHFGFKLQIREKQLLLNEHTSLCCCVCLDFLFPCVCVSHLHHTLFELTTDSASHRPHPKMHLVLVTQHLKVGTGHIVSFICQTPDASLESIVARELGVKCKIKCSGF